MRKLLFSVGAALQSADFEHVARLSESLSGGVGFRNSSRPFGVQISIANATMHRRDLSFANVDLTALLSYHLTAHMMIGFQGERVLQYFNHSVFNSLGGGARVVLSVAQ